MTGFTAALRIFGYDEQGRQRPDWAAHVLASLTDALAFGNRAGELTAEEKALITGITYRIRGRLGETTRHHAPLDSLGNYMIRDVTKSIEAEIVQQTIKEVGNG